MNRLKILVLVVFVLVAAAFFLLPGPIEEVRGSTVAGTLAAPTGISASDNSYSTKVGLHWDVVRNATLYRIFRNTSNNSGSASDVGTTAANYFFDGTALAATNYFYWVRAENSGDVSSLSTSDQGARANGFVIGSAFGVLEPPPEPMGNPVTATKAALGKALFWDEQLSSTKTVSCGTCHRPNEGGADPRTVIGDDRARNPGPDNTFNTPDDIFGSPGVPQNNASGTYVLNSLFGLRPQVTGRKAPTYLNAGYTRSSGLFWDGRAREIFRDQITNEILLATEASLESQSAGPPISSAEMAHGGRTWTDVANRVAASRPLALANNVPASLQNWIEGRPYADLFTEAFGSPGVTPARISMAIATHERTLFSDRTPLDAAIYQIQPLTAQEQLGEQLFVENSCNTCHDGPLLADHNFHNIGVRPQSEDVGRGAVTGNSEDNSKFKTPNLRNIELRAPYMHNGRIATLEEVVEFYNRGGDFDAPNIDHSLIRPLGLTQAQKDALVAFMKRPLTDPRVANQLPPFDRPQLYTESNRVPTVSGTGRPGTGSITPGAIAIEPPLLGNPSFTIAVSGALSGAGTVLVVNSTDPGVGATIPPTADFGRYTAVTQGTGINGYASVAMSIPNTPSLSGKTFYARWYVNDPAASNGFSVSQLITFKIFGGGSDIESPYDFDGDGKTDLSIFRPSPGEWWYNRSSDGGNSALQFGTSSDGLVPADFTGDGKTDIAFWRPSTGQWFILRSEDLSFYAFPFGSGGDVPVSADYDGDGRADAAVFRPSTLTWFISKSTGGTDIIGFGASGDVPTVADYDGDSKADIAIYRPNASGGAQWWVRRSSDASVFALQFGTASDRTVQGDYTGDGKADIAFWRPSSGNWFILRSENFSFYAVPFGLGSDIPTPGDYDGDGRFDTAIFRPTGATWYVNRSTAGTLIQQFGITGDIPVPSVYVR